MSDPQVPSSRPSIDKDVEAAIAFRIAEAAKQQVWSWAKWILSIAVLVLAILGIRGYTDFSNTITRIEHNTDKLIENLDKDIDAKVDHALEAKLSEVEDEIKDFEDRTRQQYSETILELERVRQLSAKSLREVEDGTKKTLQRVVTLVGETREQFDKELQAVQQSGEQARREIDSYRREVVDRPRSASGPPEGLPPPRAFPPQWHLQRTTIDGKVIDQHANVVAAWDLSTGSGVTIAVIDDGFDLDHEEFAGAGKIVAPRDVSRRSSDPRPGPGNNHGTAVAGVAAANGQHGAAGVAPQASLMPIRLVSGLGSQAEADAFMWAAENGADVISNSWGPLDGEWWNPDDPKHQIKHPLPQTTRKAIEYAIRTGRNGKGTVIVWAAGNGNESVDNDGYASYDKVIAVAACNDEGKRASYSDFGDAIWVCFPSSDFRDLPLTTGIWTTDRTGASGYNPGDSSKGDDAGNYTNTFGGTASAAPGVAGVAALILSVNPELRWNEVKEILKESADKIDEEEGQYDENGHSIYYGYGRVNALEAVKLASTYPKRDE